MSNTQAKQKITGWESPVLIHPGEHLQAFLKEATNGLIKQLRTRTSACNQIIFQRQGRIAIIAIIANQQCLW